MSLSVAYIDRAQTQKLESEVKLAANKVFDAHAQAAVQEIIHRKLLRSVFQPIVTHCPAEGSLEWMRCRGGQVVRTTAPISSPAQPHVLASPTLLS